MPDVEIDFQHNTRQYNSSSRRSSYNSAVRKDSIIVSKSIEVKEDSTYRKEEDGKSDLEKKENITTTPISVSVKVDGTKKVNGHARKPHQETVEQAMERFKKELLADEYPKKDYRDDFGVSEEQWSIIVKEFHQKCKDRGDKHHNKTDYKNNLRNWITEKGKHINPPNIQTTNNSKPRMVI